MVNLLTLLCFASNNRRPKIQALAALRPTLRPLPSPVMPGVSVARGDELDLARRLNTRLALQNAALRRENARLSRRLGRAQRRAHDVLVRALALQAAYRVLRHEFRRVRRRARRLARSLPVGPRPRPRPTPRPWRSLPVPLPRFEVSGRTLDGTLRALDGALTRADLG